MRGHLATATEGNIRGRLVTSYEGDLSVGSSVNHDSHFHVQFSVIGKMRYHETNYPLTDATTITWYASRSVVVILIFYYRIMSGSKLLLVLYTLLLQRYELDICIEYCRMLASVLIW